MFCWFPFSFCQQKVINFTYFFNLFFFVFLKLYLFTPTAEFFSKLNKEFLVLVHETEKLDKAVSLRLQSQSTEFELHLALFYFIQNSRMAYNRIRALNVLEFDFFQEDDTITSMFGYLPIDSGYLTSAINSIPATTKSISATFLKKSLQLKLKLNLLPST